MMIFLRTTIVAWLYSLTALQVEGNKVPAKDQGLTRAQGPEVGNHLLVEMGHPRVMHRDIDVYKLRTSPCIQTWR